VLTTFTKDGRPKPTPIWAAPKHDRLLAVIGADSWKVIKRIRWCGGGGARKQQSLLIDLWTSRSVASEPR
jgi:hypothetical protein